jgi:uncharacterized protein
MPADPRFVADTNTLISRLLLPGSVPAKAVSRGLERAELLISTDTFEELAEVLFRPKFDRYVTVSDRRQFLRLVYRIARPIPIVHQVRACRDPRDDKFLELAVNGDAQTILTGDRDLLALNPFRGIAIVTAAAYLAR